MKQISGFLTARLRRLTNFLTPFPPLPKPTPLRPVARYHGYTFETEMKSTAKINFHLHPSLPSRTGTSVQLAASKPQLRHPGSLLQVGAPNTGDGFCLFNFRHIGRCSWVKLLSRPCPSVWLGFTTRTTTTTPKQTHKTTIATFTTTYPRRSPVSG